MMMGMMKMLRAQAEFLPKKNLECWQSLFVVKCINKIKKGGGR
jgi:hypothetical protein